jgi:hypothetical protein
MAIAFASIAAKGEGTASAAPAYPASLANNDLVLCHVVNKPYNSTAPSFSSMMPQGSIASGAVTSGNDTGSILTTVAARIADGTMPSTETATVASGTSTLAVMTRWTCAAGQQWSLAPSTAADTVVTGTTVSATGASIHLQVGDVLVVTVGLNSDTLTHTGPPSVTAAGFTLSAMTWQTQQTTIQGGDTSLYVGHCTVTAGTAGFVTPVYTATASVSAQSAAAVIFERLREQTPALPGVIGLYANPTVEPETHGHVPPIRDGNGNLYRIGEGSLAYDTNRAIISKSIDGGKTWKPAHTLAAATTAGARDLESCWVVKKGTQMLSFLNRDDTAWCIPWNMSDAASSPDTHSATETVDSGMSSSGVIQFIGANLLSTGECWAFYTGVLNGANNTVSFKKRSTSGTYGSRLTLATSASNNYVGASPVTGASDVTYVFYHDLTTNALLVNTVSSTGTLGTPQTVASAAGLSSQSVPHTNPVYYDDGGVEVIGVAYINDSDILKYRELRNGVLQTEETISSTSVTRNPGQTDSQAVVAHLAVDGKDVHAIWSRAADGDLMHDKRTFGSGWGVEAVEWASGGSTGWYVYCDVQTVGGNVLLAYTYDQGTHVDDASNIKYNEKVIRTAGVTATLGFPTGSWTAHPLTAARVVTAGLPVASSTAAPLTTAKTVTLGLASTTDTAAPLTRAKSATTGFAAETGTVTPVDRVKAAQTALAVETDTAAALSTSSLAGATLGFAGETDTATALVRVKVATLGLAGEAGTAHPVTRSKGPTLGVAAESTTAHPDVTSKVRADALTTETDTAAPAVTSKARTLGQPVETDTAVALVVSGSTSTTLGLATELDTAAPLARSKTRTVGFAGDADTAHPVSIARARTLGLASHTHTAHPLGVSTPTGVTVTLGLAVEVDGGLQLLPGKTRTLGLPALLHTAAPLGSFEGAYTPDGWWAATLERDPFTVTLERAPFTVEL